MLQLLWSAFTCTCSKSRAYLLLPIYTLIPLQYHSTRANSTLTILFSDIPMSFWNPEKKKKINNWRKIKNMVEYIGEYIICRNGILKIIYLFIYLFGKHVWKRPMYYNIICSSVPIGNRADSIPLCGKIYGICISHYRMKWSWVRFLSGWTCNGWKVKKVDESIKWQESG
jgi:hypothetical protein